MIISPLLAIDFVVVGVSKHLLVSTIPKATSAIAPTIMAVAKIPAPIGLARRPAIRRAEKVIATMTTTFLNLGDLNKLQVKGFDLLSIVGPAYQS